MPRKRFKRTVIDEATLRCLYLEHCMRVSEIAELYDKTRQRIWQKLKEYGIQGQKIERECVLCGDRFLVVRSRVRKEVKYCSNSCYQQHRRNTGGLMIDSNQGRIKARQVMAELIGRDLRTGEVVHHIDGDQNNSDINNLVLFPNHSAHMAFHHRQRINS